MVGVAFACAVPVVAAGAILIRVARSWSLTVSMVVLVLIPTVATFAGVLGASGFMITFASTAVVLVIVSVVTIPAAIMLARYQARRMVWEQQIHESEEAAELSRRRLVAFVSHDLRTPLAGIRAVEQSRAGARSFRAAWIARRPRTRPASAAGRSACCSVACSGSSSPA